VNVFFDVDYTILGTDYELRAGTADTFFRLAADGHEVHVWSGEGERHEVVHDFALQPYVSGVYEKPIGDDLRRPGDFGIACVPDFVVDDDPGIVAVFGGFHVSCSTRKRPTTTRWSRSIAPSVTSPSGDGAATPAGTLGTPSSRESKTVATAAACRPTATGRRSGPGTRRSARRAGLR